MSYAIPVGSLIMTPHQNGGWSVSRVTQMTTFNVESGIRHQEAPNLEPVGAYESWAALLEAAQVYG